MSEKPKVYVAGIGMITAVGDNAVTTAAAVKAGKSAFRESSHHNKNFNPIKMALVPNDALPPLNPKLESVAELTARQRRMLRLATPALEEVLSTHALKEPIPLFLAGPETLPQCPAPIQMSFIDHLIVQTSAKINREQSRIIASGRAGGLQAIELAFKYFETTRKHVVLIGGVDTYLDYYLLSVLDADNRILAEGIMDGFVPGEAAAFLLLVSEKGRSYLKHAPLATLYPPGIAQEPGHRYSELPYRGDGLAEAFRLAIHNGNGTPIQAIYASLNGENIGAKEYGVASTRNSAALASEVKLEHPADCFGDIGAAFGPVLLGVIATAKRRDTLCYCASDQDARAAVIVTTA